MSHDIEFGELASDYLLSQNFIHLSSMSGKVFFEGMKYSGVPFLFISLMLLRFPGSAHGTIVCPCVAGS